MKKIAANVLLVLLLSTVTSAFAGEELVLIVSSGSNIDQLDSSAVRKLFLGLTVQSNGNRLRPLLNESDAQLKEIFLQNIVSMSDSTYDRYVLQLSLQQGRKQPVVYRSNTQLIDSVAADPAAVSYAWVRDVEHDGRIRILRVVWHD
ncbi:MAG TPA: hypothetical protein VNR70_07960 [Steroidobacteraceae bacterium]|nr:hypothetical protein [Steroidobacteraceae bacterium]